MCSLPPFHQIPCASIVSFNSTSLSHYTQNQNKMNKIIEKFVKRYDIIFLQETKLLAKENQALKTIASNHEVFYSNNLSNTGDNATTYTAGVLTAISKKITSKYKVKVVDLPLCLSGHCLVVHISLPGTDFSIKFINIRLVTPSQNKIAAQEMMIKDLHIALAPLPTKFTVLGGDLNFVECAADTTSKFKIEERPCWENFKKMCSISECHSDLHSFFHKPGTAAGNHSQNMWSARLDRFYISHTEADLAVVKPVVVSDVQAVTSAGDHGINAHIPTSLHFFPRGKKVAGPRRISDATIENKNFAPYTEELWEQTISRQPLANPLERLEIFSSVLRKASKQIFQDHKNEIDLVVVFQKALALYNHLSSDKPDEATVLRLTNNTPLGAIIYQDENGWCTTALKAFIDNSFKVAGTPEGVEERKHEPGVASPPHKQKVNALKELKFKLPSTRTKIEALRVGPEKTPSNKPAEIGPLIQEHYGRIWKSAEVGENRQESLDYYLKDYDRRIDPKDVLEIDIGLVENAIRMAPATSPGPDGIPFSAFKANIALAGPIILDVCRFLGIKRDEMTIGRFNFANLYLLPKKDTLEVDDTRPISVNNAGNRLVARVLFLAVAGASQKLIGDYQKMFLPTRQMTDHLRSLNANYYQMVQDKLDYFVLFTDNAKAFDSIHHDFILASLNKQGFPAWFINAVHNLLTAVKVSPTLAPDFIIDINRGVKQGCPLSPLLFILCYDVLNFKLAPLDNVVVKAAADDLAIETRNIEDAILAFPIIDEFTVASGLGINRNKTVILSAKDCSHRSFAPKLLLIQNSRWPLVKVVNSHKYLGILFGRTIQVEDVYAAPAGKAIERARRFGPALRMLDVQRRIMAFNVFITPIFSFVQQFYTMPSSVLREYRSVMRRAISPFGGTAWPYSQLCAPTACGGFRQPLRDPWSHGVSLILKNFDFSIIITENDLPWNLDGSFRAGLKRTCNWDSPVFSDHVELQVMEFLGPSFMNWDGSSQLPRINKTEIKKLAVERLIVSYGAGNSLSYTRNFGRDHTSHLRHRLLCVGVADIGHTLSHFSTLPKNVPAFLVTHYIKVICGALNSDGGRRRMYDSNASDHPDRCTSNPQPCYLCGAGDAVLPGDCSRHLFSSCEIVRNAWDLVISGPGGPADLTFASYFENSSAPLYALDYPPADGKGGYNRLGLVMTFCWAIHKTISQIRMGRVALGADRRACALILSLKNIWCPSSKS